MSGAARPKIGSEWTPDQVAVCEVRATWSDGVDVRWLTPPLRPCDRVPPRRCIFTPLSKFYDQFSRRVAPFDPAIHADRFTELS